jgi:hypothetical protein
MKYCALFSNGSYHGLQRGYTEGSDDPLAIPEVDDRHLTQKKLAKLRGNYLYGYIIIARYATASQPTNEVILLIFYKCSFSKERSVLPKDGRITETCSSQLIFYCFRHFKLSKINIKCICW